ncbi:hypothetical protein CBR_g2850 [Chara braunii]|uniref:DUF659 domain-containing protein n=1 Tax=Chara braunii TaxID=69332 RepID=A0A388KE20_CHABU|nr:hypothetical protein CBR_g2850 [Chara braunii]|eukprot:GBG68304.1 hypothetical protein CBR_g2850 [Chara braunii]
MPKGGSDAIKRHFVQLEVVGDPDKGKYKWKCWYCEHVFPGTANRYAKHFMSTTKGPRCNMARVSSRLSAEEKERRELGRLEAIALVLGKRQAHEDVDEFEECRSQERDVDEQVVGEEDECNSPTSPQASTQKQPNSTRSSNIRARQTTLEEGGAIVSKNEEAQRSIDDWLVFDRVPFTMVRSKYFLRMLQKVREAERSFIPAKYDVQRTKRLDVSEARVAEGVARQHKRWARTGCMLQLDGWTDRKGRPHLNVMVSFPTGVVFWKSHCMSGKEKGSEAYFNILSQSIKEVGEKVVVGVIMDNAAVCARAGRLVEDTFPTIFHVPCAAHCLDLMLHDIGRTDWVKEVVGKGNDVVKFFMNHQRERDIFYVHSGGRQMLRPAATRFATNFHMLDHLKKQRNALVATVRHDARWKPTVVPHVQRDTFHEMEEIVLDGAGFWEGVNKVISAVYDIVLLLKVVDGTGPTISKLYARMDKAVERLRGNPKLPKDEREDIKEMIMRRWNVMTTPLHCAALFLDPEYRSWNMYLLDTLQQMPEMGQDVIDWDDPPTEEEQEQAERAKLAECRLKRIESSGEDAAPPPDEGGDEGGDEAADHRREPCELDAIEDGHAEDWRGLTKAGMYMASRSHRQARKKARSLGTAEHMRKHMKRGGVADPRDAATAAQVGQQEKRGRGRPRKYVAPENGEASNLASIEEVQEDAEECSDSDSEEENEGEGGGLQRKRQRDGGQSEEAAGVATSEYGTSDEERPIE